MSTTHVQDELLQRYFDGEVEARQATEVRAHVDGCPDCSARMTALSRLHTLLSSAGDEFADSVHSDALFARIREGVRAAPAAGLGERLRLWWDDLIEPLRPQGMWMPATAAVGVAVALFVVTRLGGAPASTEVAVRVPSTSTFPAPSVPEPVPAPAPPTALPPTQLAALVPLPTEVAEIDTGTNIATMFTVETGEGRSAQVVWIQE